MSQNDRNIPTRGLEGRVINWGQTVAVMFVMLIFLFGVLALSGAFEGDIGEEAAVTGGQRMEIITEVCDRMEVDGRLWIWCDTVEGELIVGGDPFTEGE